MENNVKYSIVVPVYNEQESVENCYSQLKKVLNTLKENNEIIFVNDGSTDGSLQILKDIAKKDKSVKIISLSRNFGQQSALLAGFKNASGEAVVNIDADLQDPPEAILLMIEKFKEGYDIVLGKRRVRKGEKFFKRTLAKIYTKFLNLITNNKIPTDMGDFRLVSKRVNNLIVSMTEHNRFLRGMTSFVGFKQAVVEFDRVERKEGKTKYNFKKLASLGADGIVSNSVVPLNLIFVFSLCCFLTGALLVLIFLILACFSLFISITGWLIPLILCLSGVILFSMGILGLYVGRTFTEVQSRPIYIVDETINFEKTQLSEFDVLERKDE